MGLERRGVGRGMQGEQTEGTSTGDSVGNDYTSRRSPGPMGLGGTDGLDAAHVDGPGAGSERRPMVQSD
jgi:hypothetical protein